MKPRALGIGTESLVTYLGEASGLGKETGLYEGTGGFSPTSSRAFPGPQGRCARVPAHLESPPPGRFVRVPAKPGVAGRPHDGTNPHSMRPSPCRSPSNVWGARHAWREKSFIFSALRVRIRQRFFSAALTTDESSFPISLLPHRNFSFFFSFPSPHPPPAQSLEETGLSRSLPRTSGTHPLAPAVVNIWAPGAKATPACGVLGGCARRGACGAGAAAVRRRSAGSAPGDRRTRRPGPGPGGEQWLLLLCSQRPGRLAGSWARAATTARARPLWATARAGLGVSGPRAPGPCPPLPSQTAERRSLGRSCAFPPLQLGSSNARKGRALLFMAGELQPGTGWRIHQARSPRRRAAPTGGRRPGPAPGAAPYQLPIFTSSPSHIFSSAIRS